MSTLANSEDSDNVEFYQDLGCLLKQKLSSEKEIQFHLEIITCDPFKYTMDNRKFIVPKQN